MLLCLSVDICGLFTSVGIYCKQLYSVVVDQTVCLFLMGHRVRLVFFGLLHNLGFQSNVLQNNILRVQKLLS